jgi:hypothetical protein
MGWSPKTIRVSQVLIPSRKTSSRLWRNWLDAPHLKRSTLQVRRGFESHQPHHQRSNASRLDRSCGRCASMRCSKNTNSGISSFVTVSALAGEREGHRRCTQAFANNVLGFVLVASRPLSGGADRQRLAQQLVTPLTVIASASSRRQESIIPMLPNPGRSRPNS